VRQPRVRFGPIVALVAILGAALLAPVGLNLAGVRSQFQVAQLQQRVDDLVAERSALKAEHAALSSTQRVKETADRLGMVTPPEVGFIALGGTTAGDDTPSAVALAGSAADRVGDSLVVASRESGSGR
jgi:cell division protein FtsB